MLGGLSSIDRDRASALIFDSPQSIPSHTVLLPTAQASIDRHPACAALYWDLPQGTYRPHRKLKGYGACCGGLRRGGRGIMTDSVMYSACGLTLVSWDILWFAEVRFIGVQGHPV